MNNNNTQQANEAAPVHEQHQHGMSPLSMATVQIIQERARCSSRQPGATYIFFGHTSGRYSWLRPGWGLEELRMPTSRLDRYYYYPSGRMDNTKYEVVHVWAQHGIILIED